MTDTPTPEQLPTEEVIASGNVTSLKFTQTGPMEWVGEANCKHGITRNATFQITPGVPPLNHAAMVEATYRQHEQLLGTECPRDTPILNASATFSTASGVAPGQQRYITQTAATIQPPAKNFFFGPGLTCARTGAYQVVAKVQLIRGIPGGGGLGVIIVSGVPIINQPMVDEGGKATANINAIINLAANQSVNVGYENTTPIVQDVALTTLTVSEVWVP